jgi:hypothetical protein
MLIPNKFNGYHNGTRQLHISMGGGGGGGGPTQTNVQNTNVPEYARPYVETMLGATQEQLFNTEKVAATPDSYDASGNLVPGTAEYTKIGSFKPYQAYGGTYDDQGKQLSYDPGKSIAGFSPEQTAAQRGITGMQLSGGFGDAGRLAGAAGQGGMDSAGRAYGYGDQGQQSGLMGQGLGMRGGQLGITGGAQYGGMGAGYGIQGAGYGAQGAGLADTALGYGQDSSDIGRMGLRAEQYGRQVSGQAEDYARQAAGAGMQYAQMATDPRITQALMNPYTQNVLDVQNKELERQAGIASNARGAQAARSGAFGGSRQGIENAEANRSLAMMKNANQAQALNQAYQQAQAQQQFGANLNLQGLQGAQQGLGTALQGGQLGLSGIGTALQGQQGALAGLGAANQAYQTGIQGSQAGMAGAGMGLQGVNAQLAGVDRQLAGTAQGMQGAQVGLQGVSGAQAGYGLANQAASNMSNIAGQQQAAELNMFNAQNAVGAQKQALEQQKINQSIQDYANAQQYPLMQLGTMSNMLRGLPMQAQTTQQYQAAPNQLSQAIGTIGAGSSIYNAFKPGPAGAAGGEVKGYAKGGIMSYDMGGEVESQLESMDEKGLAEQARESSSPSIRKIAQRLLRERQMSRQPQGAGPMGVQYQAAQPEMPTMRSGGIIAFSKGETVYGGPSSEADAGEAEAKIDMDKRLAMEPTTGGGIMGAAPVAPPPPVSRANLAMQQTAGMPDFMKAQYEDADRRLKMTGAEHMAETEKLYAAAGVGGQSEGQQKQRTEMMAEKANMADENKRQKYMRMAEFFASWGSTPGPTLVAGLNAVKQSLPGIISDEKEQKKARREIDKSIADLDNAVRLEKRGDIDKGQVFRLKAAEDMKALQTKFIDYQSQRERDAAGLEGHRISAKGQTDAAAMRNASDKAYRTQAESNKNDDRIYGRYLASTKEYNDVVTDVARQESQDAHKNDLKKLEQYTMGAVNKKTGEIDVSKISPSYKAPYAETLERVTKRKEGWATAISDAKKEKDIAYTRYTNLSAPTGSDKPKPKGAPTVSLDDPSLQK